MTESSWSWVTVQATQIRVAPAVTWPLSSTVAICGSTDLGICVAFHVKRSHRHQHPRQAGPRGYVEYLLIRNISLDNFKTDYLFLGHWGFFFVSSWMMNIIFFLGLQICYQIPQIGFSICHKMPWSGFWAWGNVIFQFLLLLLLGSYNQKKKSLVSLYPEALPLCLI